jgi:hypothetical protein
MRVKVKIHSRLRQRLAGQVRDALATTVTRMVPVVVTALSRVADAKLHRTAKLYKAELPESITATSTGLKIELTGVARDLEIGYPARDMKQEMLSSPKAKTGADGGKYIDVPFRHATNEKAVRYQGMPQEIKNRVMAAVKTERRSAAEEGRAERNPLRVTGKLPAQSPKHATSIHSDMMRVARQAGSRVSSTYHTIRRLSSKSDAQAWWHPGFSGIRALRDVKSELEQAMKAIFKSEATRRGFKTK